MPPPAALVLMSAGLTAAACTRIRICPGPGPGTTTWAGRRGASGPNRSSNRCGGAGTTRAHGCRAWCHSALSVTWCTDTMPVALEAPEVGEPGRYRLAGLLCGPHVGAPPDEVLPGLEQLLDLRADREVGPDRPPPVGKHCFPPVVRAPEPVRQARSEVALEVLAQQLPQHGGITGTEGLVEPLAGGQARRGGGGRGGGGGVGRHAAEC